MKKQTQSSARLTQDHSGNTWQCQIFLYIPFPSFQLLFSVSLLFLSYLVLADPSENLDGLAVCHIEVGNEDSIVYTLGCSCPYFPDRRGRNTPLQDSQNCSVHLGGTLLLWDLPH